MCLAVVICIFLSGCGGGSSGSGSHAALIPVSGDSGSYAPYNLGNSWTYRVTRNQTGKSTVIGLDFVKVTKSDAVNGAVEAVLTETFDSGNRSDRSIVKKDGGLFSSDGGYPILKFPLMVNDHFLQMNLVGADYGEDLDRDGVSERIDVQSEVTVVGVGTIQAMAGTFENCVQVQIDGRETMHYSSDSSTQTMKVTTTEWYAPGIGLVSKSISVTSGNIVAKESYNLTAYHIDGRNSESSPPTVLSVDQTQTVPASAASAITAHFSEEMDPLSLNPATFTVSDSGGQSVTGTVSYSSASAQFIPAVPLRSGTYTATISTGAQDLAGNPLAQDYSWSFTVDANPPLVVSTYPLAGAAAVSVTSAITATFSEPIKMSDPYSFVVRGPDQESVWGDVSHKESSTWTFTPRNALEHGTTYRATITGAVRDTAGNYLPAAYSWSFTTPPAVFDRYLTVPVGSEAQAVAIGDVTGDGRNDVVVLTGYSGRSSMDNRLLVYPQNGSGGLGSPINYPTSGTYTSRLFSVAIGDVNHDGRNDVVLTSLGSSIEVFLQNPAGGLSAPIDYPTPYSFQVRVADVNEDGRDDVVSMGIDKVAVYLQDATGKLVPSGTYAATADGFSDLALGDVNHDGHIDIVVSGVAVLAGRGDGTFNAGADYPASAGSIAVGDLNGDGLNDIAVGSAGLLYQTGSNLIAPLTQRYLGSSIRIADIDNDGRQDAIVQHGGWGHIGVFFQRADGTLGEEDSYASVYGSSNPGTLAIGDINGDGFNDVVVVDQSGLTLHYNKGQAVSAKQTARKAKALSRSLPRTMREFWRRLKK